MRRLVPVAVTVALAAASLAVAGEQRAGPAARAAETTGTFTQANSRDGMPIFTAAGIGPGDSASGSVVISNTGSLGGSFTLSPEDLADAPGPGGGTLSGALDLLVRQTSPTAATVFSGKLAAMGPRPLGWFAPGEARGYTFTATLPHGGADNAYAGSSMSVRYRWTGVEAPPPDPGPPAPAPPAGGAPQPGPPAGPAQIDRRPPRLRVTVAAVQRVLDTGAVVVGVRCGERCRVAVTGRAWGPGVRRTAIPARRRAIGRGRAARIRLALPRRLLRAAPRLLRSGAPITLRARFVARDRAGNTSVALRTIRVRALRR